MAIKPRIETLLAQLNERVLEKEELVRLALLSSIAGESIFLLGPPGVAKSLVARKLKFAYKNAKVFEYLMSRFSTPDEIFGPVSISKLKDKDEYERLTTNYLPDAEVVFLDEIWKAGPSIQNTLLTVINEKKFRNGKSEINVPMKALISTSNESPAHDLGLEALWDRFLVRLRVDGIANKDNFDAMISEKLNPYEDTVSEKITNEEYKEWSKGIDEIEIPANIFYVIDIIRKIIQVDNDKEENAGNQMYVSDRRWRKIARLLRTSAFLNDRKEVDLIDCFLIKDCIWDEDRQRDAVWGYVCRAISEYGYMASVDIKGIQGELREFKTEIDGETKIVTDERLTVPANAQSEYYELVMRPGNPTVNLIRQSDFKKLTNTDATMYLHYWNKNYQKTEPYDRFGIRKGPSEFSVFVDDVEFQLKTEIKGAKRQITKMPQPGIAKDWDEKIAGFLERTADMKKHIELCHSKDREHLRSNLFVDPSFANFVDNHVTAAIKEIEKIEIEIREIQNGYKTIKEEEVVIND
ncbi:ATPase [Spirochaetia bacterium]|nr:ATPase [Spirochaetia bacterium]